MDRIEAACANPAAREELNKLVQHLGIRIGLTFREGRRNNRPVRVLQGGGLHGVGNLFEQVVLFNRRIHGRLPKSLALHVRWRRDFAALAVVWSPRGHKITGADRGRP